MKTVSKAATPFKLQLDTHVLGILFRAGELAGSPRAAILADPCVCTSIERVVGPSFIFSDIPDKHFREPKEIIHLSNRYSAGGVKS